MISNPIYYFDIHIRIKNLILFFNTWHRPSFRSHDHTFPPQQIHDFFCCCLFSFHLMVVNRSWCWRRAGTSHAIVIVFKITWSRVRSGQGTTPNKSIWDVMREQKEAFEKWRLHLHGAHAAQTSARPRGCVREAREDQHLHPDQWDAGQEKSPNRQLGL